MEIMESIRAVIKELILPDLDRIKEESREIKSILTLTNKRLDDVNLHLADQSRRIDAVRKDLTERIDETNRRIDAVREDLTARIDETNNRINETNKRIDETNKRIDAVGDALAARVNEINSRIDKTNEHLGHLYEVIVRREEHFLLTDRVVNLEREVASIKEKLAA